MSKAEARTVLLARPGESRDRLRAALEQAGVELVLMADPLEVGIDEVAGANARNLVIAVDAEVEFQLTVGRGDLLRCGREGPAGACEPCGPRVVM